MKKILLLGTMMVMSTTVFAFGGGGSSRKSSLFTSGVDAIGVHINGKTCPDGQELVDNKCYQKCADGVIRGRNNNCDICENGNVYLSYNVGAECDTVVEDFTGCKSNADCAEDEFCNLVNETDSSCYYPTSGTCQAITSIEYTDATIDGLGDVRYGNGYLNWWAAANWCKAQKHGDGSSMRLPTVEEIKCYIRGTDTLITTDSGNKECCIGDNQTCQYWQTAWDGNTIKPGSETVVAQYSPVIVNLRKTFDTRFFMTGTNYSSTDSCYVLGMNLNTGFTTKHSRKNGYNNTLCK